MSTSPVFSITLLEQNTANAYIVFNEAIQKLEALSGGVGIVDKDLTSPPGSPDEGALYIVGGSATGAWSGYDNYIAQYYNTGGGATWYYYAPVEGMVKYVNDEDIIYAYNGTNWVAETS